MSFRRGKSFPPCLVAQALMLMSGVGQCFESVEHETVGFHSISVACNRLRLGVRDKKVRIF